MEPACEPIVRAAGPDRRRPAGGAVSRRRRRGSGAAASSSALGRPSVAIVGTRAATPYGRRLAERFAAELGARGLLHRLGPRARDRCRRSRRGAERRRRRRSASWAAATRRFFPSAQRRARRSDAGRRRRGALAVSARSTGPSAPVSGAQRHRRGARRRRGRDRSTGAQRRAQYRRLGGRANSRARRPRRRRPQARARLPRTDPRRRDTRTLAEDVLEAIGRLNLTDRTRDTRAAARSRGARAPRARSTPERRDLDGIVATTGLSAPAALAALTLLELDGSIESHGAASYARVAAYRAAKSMVDECSRHRRCVAGRRCAPRICRCRRASCGVEVFAAAARRCVRGAAPSRVRRLRDQCRLFARQKRAPFAAADRNRARRGASERRAATRAQLQPNRTGRRFRQPAARARASGRLSSQASCAREIGSARRPATACACRSSSAARTRPGRSLSCRDARCRSARRWPTRCAFAVTTSSSNGSSTTRAASSTRSDVRSTPVTGKSSAITPYPTDGYPGEYLIPIAQRIAQRDGERWVGADEVGVASVLCQVRTRRARSGTAADGATLRRRLRSLAERTGAARNRKGSRRHRAPARAWVDVRGRRRALLPRDAIRRRQGPRAAAQRRPADVLLHGRRLPLPEAQEQRPRRRRPRTRPSRLYRAPERHGRRAGISRKARRRHRSASHAHARQGAGER